MAVAYDIKAIPTVYGARQFRSRLEAKWAAFFDQSGWEYEYEPFDLGSWSPDFLLTKARVLVEVKPITEIDQDTADKMAAAATQAKWDGELLLVGVAPIFTMGTGPYESSAIGWLGEDASVCEEMQERRYQWGFSRAAACMAPNGMPDFMSEWNAYYGRVYGAGFKRCHWPETPGWLKSEWDRAANKVQWHKR